MKSIRLLLLLSLMAWAAFATAMDNGAGRPGAIATLDDAFVGVYNRTLSAGAFRMTVTNMGTFGNSSPGSMDNMYDPCSGNWAPQLQYPSNSDVQYLFQGGLWIGALMEIDGSEQARVSTAMDGWFANADIEWEPVTTFTETSVQPGAMNCLGDSLYDSATYAPQLLTSSAVDTATIGPTGSPVDHPIDGAHIPLGLKVTSRVSAYSSLNYDKFAIVEYTIRNISGHDLKDTYLGLYVDGDVGVPNTQPYIDDITGFLQNYNGRSVDIAWIADGDGRGMGSDTLQSPAALGMTVLSSPGDAPLGGYNWWISNADSDLDFGPATLTSDTAYDWTATYGTPVSDARKYQLLSNHEVDYDQVRVNDPTWIADHPLEYTDPMTGETIQRDWRTPDGSNPNDLANGYDTRFMLSWGPLGTTEGSHRYLHPGDEITLAVAVLLGDGFHDPNHMQSGDVLDPSLYDYSGLVTAAEHARWVYQNRETSAPPPPPARVSVFQGFSGRVVAWDSFPAFPDAMFNIYRDDGAGTWGENALNSSPLDRPSFVDRTAGSSATYRYRVQTVRFDTLASHVSMASSASVDALLPITGAELLPDDGEVQLSWNALPSQNADGYRVWRAEFTSATNQHVDPEQIATVTSTEYTDSDPALQNGHSYAYWIQPTLGDVEGSLNGPYTATPLDLTGNLLFIYEYSDGTLPSPWSSDEITAFYEGLLSDLGVDYDLLEINADADSLHLADLSGHSRVWMALDNMIPVARSIYKLSRNTVLASYVAQGGHLMVSGRELSDKMLFYGPPHEFTTHTVDEWKTAFGFDACMQSQMGQARLLTAIADASNLQNLVPDPDRYDPYDFIGGITAFHPAEGSTTLYIAEAAERGDALDGQPLAYLHSADGVQQASAVIMAGFPLYGMGSSSAVSASVNEMLTLLASEGPSVEQGGGSQPGELADGETWRIQPNPFNGTTAVCFQLEHSSRVSLRLYNLLGQEVLSQPERMMGPGEHTLSVKADHLPSGLYFLRLTTSANTRMAKVMLVK